MEVPFKAIQDGLNSIGEFFENLLNYINPFSDKFFLKDFFAFITSALSYINPFNENFIFKDFFSNFVSWFNPFSENFILLKLWNFLTDIISYINPFSENFFVYKLIDLLGNLLKWLFIPENNPFDSLSSKFDEKFAFINQIKSLFSSLLGFNNYGDSAPTFNMTWSGVTFAFIDFSMFLNYRTWLHAIILAISWFIFIRKTFNKLPGIIGGFSQ